MSEEWKDIPEVFGCQASTHGRVKNYKGKILSFSVGRKGYYICTIRNKQYSVNRLVCSAFHGHAPSDKHHAAHINGKPLDNSPDNLYWATPKQNMQDRETHNTLKFGENHPGSKLSTIEVLEIRERYELGDRIYVIHKDFSYVCRATISHICHGRIRNHE